MMKQTIAICLAGLLLLTQVASLQAVSCSDIWVDPEDVFIERDETEYFYFPVYNDSLEDFSVYEARTWLESGDFEIWLLDYPNTIDAEDEGELTIKVETWNLDEESQGEASIDIRGEFEEGKYCGFSNIGTAFFDVTVEIAKEDPACRDIEIDAHNVYIGENREKTVSLSIENSSDEDFELYDISVEESSPYFNAWLYSKPREIDSGDSETFRVRIESNRVSRDRQGRVSIEAKGRFDNGKYCSYSSIQDEDFTVFVENGSGPSSEPEPAETCEDLYLNAGSVKVEKGATAYATIFLENDSSQDFLVDYVSVFDSSSNFRAGENGYARLIPAFGSAFVNVKIEAYSHAETGKFEAFVEAKGHFQNRESCYIGQGIMAFPVVVEERQTDDWEGQTGQAGLGNSCTHFSLIVPEQKEIGNSGTVPITIDNRTAERATVRLSGPGLTVQPLLISIPRNSLVSESISVSSALPETRLLYSIEALGCNATKATEITASAAEAQGQGEAEQGQAEAIQAISTGFLVLGQAGGLLGLLVLAALAIYLAFGQKTGSKPKKKKGTVKH